MKKEMTVKQLDEKVVKGDWVRLLVTEDSHQRSVFDYAIAYPFSWEDELPIARMAIPDRSLRINLQKGEEWIGKVKDMFAPGQNPTVTLRGTTFTKHYYIITDLQRQEKTTINFKGNSLVRKVLSGSRVLSLESVDAGMRHVTFLCGDKLITVEEFVVGNRIAMRRNINEVAVQTFIASKNLRNFDKETVRLLHPSMSKGQYESLGRLYCSWDNLKILAASWDFTDNIMPVDGAAAA